MITHSKPTISDEDIHEVMQIFKASKIADNTEVSSFEKELSEYIGQEVGIATNSGGSALHMALLGSSIGSHDEVIIPSFACIALLNAVNYVRATPIIADIDPIDYNISLKSIKEKITRRTRAIIAPHMFGKGIRNIENIVDLGFTTIEDCALSVGADVKGRRVGSFSDTSIFSFAATKVITTGVGGMVLSSSKRTIERIKNYMQYDSRTTYDLSFNYKMSDIQASLGRSQLRRLGSFIERRKEIASEYTEGLKDLGPLQPPPIEEGNIFFRYIVNIPDADDFIGSMLHRGIICSKPVFKPLHQYLGLTDSDYPNTSSAYRTSVSLPIYPSLSNNELNFVINNIKEVLI